jgi:putative phosphoribosyl transferase
MKLKCPDTLFQRGPKRGATERTTPEMHFRDRIEAGQVLAAKLAAYADRGDVVVLALPRGGVPVAFEVAQALHAPLDVFLVRKLGAPGHTELAMGAIASGGVRVLNDNVIRGLRIADETIDAVAAQERQELRRRERLYRGDQAEPDVRGRTVILVDDGLATGSTMRAAVLALRQQRPARTIVAVPVGSRENCDELGQEADEALCAVTPDPFIAVGHWYGDFTQTTDEEVRELLKRHREQEAIHGSRPTHLRRSKQPDRLETSFPRDPPRH